MCWPRARRAEEPGRSQLPPMTPGSKAHLRPLCPFLRSASSRSLAPSTSEKAPSITYANKQRRGDLGTGNVERMLLHVVPADVRQEVPLECPCPGSFQAGIFVELLCKHIC